MRYIIDIDGTICTNTYGKYEEATPLPENIKKINILDRQGLDYWHRLDRANHPTT